MWLNVHSILEMHSAVYGGIAEISRTCSPAVPDSMRNPPPPNRATLPQLSRKASIAHTQKKNQSEAHYSRSPEILVHPPPCSTPPGGGCRIQKTPVPRGTRVSKPIERGFFSPGSASWRDAQRRSASGTCRYDPRCPRTGSYR